jgi:hypothetical protein
MSRSKNMTSIQISARDGRIPLSLVAIVVAVAFGLGALIGFGLPRIVEGAGHTSGSTLAAAAGSAFVAQHDMSAAAYAALHGPTTTTTTTTMSDAAYAATHPASNAR